MSKATKYLRVKFDLSLELTEEVTSTGGLVGSREANRVMLAILAVLSGNPKIISVAPGMGTAVSLDNRPRNAVHGLIE